MEYEIVYKAVNGRARDQYHATVDSHELLLRRLTEVHKRASESFGEEATLESVKLVRE